MVGELGGRVPAWKRTPERFGPTSVAPFETSKNLSININKNKDYTCCELTKELICFNLIFTNTVHRSS